MQIKKFEIEVHNKIMDILINSMDERFIKNIDIYRQFSVFDPRNFEDSCCFFIINKLFDKVLSDEHISCSYIE